MAGALEVEEPPLPIVALETIEPAAENAFGARPRSRGRFRGNLFLQVRSTIVARGTAAQPILFTSDAEIPTAGDWNGIRIEDTATGATLSPQGDYVSGSILEYVIVQYAAGCRRWAPAS